MGAFIGDLCSSCRELEKYEADDTIMKYLMTMPGGGKFGLRSGQGTDDSELELCLLNALNYGE